MDNNIEPTNEQLLVYAQGVVERWEKMDVFACVTEAEKSMLYNGKPVHVWLAEKFIEAMDTIGRYEAEEYDRHMDARFNDTYGE
jgi:hypothetical protein